MRYLITGHTGFKGAWFTALLASRGHEVCGYALDPEPGSLFEAAGLAELCRDDIRADVRDPEALAAAMSRVQPDVVVHMAAQPLVRESYRQPRLTMETNVMGTLNVLEAVRAQDCVAAHLVVTTDKVYRNVGQRDGYREDDPLGGADPYSASKAMADLLVESWNHSFAGPPTAVVRAGNVIGGGDVSSERLLPDVFRALQAGEAPKLRNPAAVRPWQHVLDCLGGYAMVVDDLLRGDGSAAAGGSFNIGPDPQHLKTVAEVVSLACRIWGDGTDWISEGSEPQLREAELLTLDPTKAADLIGWSGLLGFEESVEWTVRWQREVAEGADARAVTEAQVARYEERAQAARGDGAGAGQDAVQPSIPG